MTELELFFDWLRSMQDDKRLSQNEVDTANELLKTTTPEQLKAWLIEVNDWDTEQSKKWLYAAIQSRRGLH